MKKCFKCGVKITIKNSYNCDYNKNNNICKICRNTYSKNWLKKNWDKNLAYKREYSKNLTKKFQQEVSKEERLFIKEHLIDRDELYNKVIKELDK